ncbi:MAG: hypothetical protein M4579_000078 [Chaenotheca gracillima]|nr:MAG: hypothetical protein M4579_000078 [Chaenotheca gracillima]
MPGAPKSAEPTSKEAFFMLHVLNNQDGNPKVNWGAVASAVGLKNGATASVRFGQIKKRLGWENLKATSVPGTKTTSTPSPCKVTKSTPKKGTPTGRGRGRPANKGRKQAIADELDSSSAPEDDDHTHGVKRERKPRIKIQDEDDEFLDDLGKFAYGDAENGNGFGDSKGQDFEEEEQETDEYHGDDNEIEYEA